MAFFRRQLIKAAVELFRDQPTSAPAAIAERIETAAECLRGRFPGLSDRDAYRAAVDGWSQIEGQRSHCSVDLESSTEHLVVLIDDVTKTRRFVPVVDLVRILGPRIAA